MNKKEESDTSTGVVSESDTDSDPEVRRRGPFVNDHDVTTMAHKRANAGKDGQNLRPEEKKSKVDQTPSQEEAESLSIAENEVHCLLERWSSALATSDPDAVAYQYKKGAVLDPDNLGDPVVGVESIKDYYSNFMKQKPLVEVIGYRASTWKNGGQCDITISETGAKAKDVECVFVFAREDGQWKIDWHRCKAKPAMTMRDACITIDNAETDGRINAGKAARLRGYCDPIRPYLETIFCLVCESIPTKRNGSVYQCKVCEVPKIGHVCKYCPVCSTSKIRNKKEDHSCKFCIKCFEAGKKNKKVVKKKREGHTCPYGE